MRNKSGESFPPSRIGVNLRDEIIVEGRASEPAHGELIDVGHSREGESSRNVRSFQVSFILVHCAQNVD
jgi:hypothetical protein